MNIKPSVLLLILVPFSVISACALWQVGYIGIFTASFANWGTAQVLCDLVVTSPLAMLWMVNDARMRGTSAWPFVLLTLLAGSFGPLLYLLRRGRVAAQAAAVV